MEYQMARNNVYEKNEVFMSVKEEESFIFLDEDDHNLSLPSPIEGLRDIGPPPFLKKTFEMVEDPKTNSIISWSCTRNSFVVWDINRLSTDMLPKHFKHNNFSSFVRQLNTYRFRKIDSDRWEFANECFQQGKKHLLKYIKRRKQNSPIFHHQAAQSWLDPTKHGVETELEEMRTDRNTLKSEIFKLRQQQGNTHRYLAEVKARLHDTESRQKGVIVFLIKSLKDPLFLQDFVEKMKRRRVLSDGGISKKRRLESGDKMVDIDDARLQAQEELTMVKSETQTLFSSDDSGSPAQEHKGGSSCETNSTDVCSENFILWEKLMEDDMIYEEEQEEETEKQSDIVLELENLIAKPLLQQGYDPVQCLLNNI